MKSILFMVGLLGLISSATGCSYAGVAASGDKVVVLRNGAFANNAFVCKVGDTGVTNCAENESP